MRVKRFEASRETAGREGEAKVMALVLRAFQVTLKEEHQSL
jgi:hypothetical protein